MRIPSFKALQSPIPDDFICHSYAKGIHPDPRFYKYRWWIFWKESPVDGHAFLDDAYSLPTADAIALMDALAEQREPYWVYNKSSPRLEPGVTPFDPQHRRWKDIQFAPALSDDPDAEWQGHR